MLHDLLLAIWFLVPAALANAAPVFAARIPGLAAVNTRLDFGATYKGRDVFGSHKTWRGLIAGMALATLVLWIQYYFMDHSDWAHYIVGRNDYSHIPVYLLGPLLGLGALGGDAIESFFKRQRGIASGTSWTPFDQLDYVVGSILITLPFIQFTVIQYVLMLLIWCSVHIASTYIGWLLGLKKDPI